MDQAQIITIPLVNPNEPEALLAAVHVENGNSVGLGTPLFTLETTKSTLDVTSISSGYVVGMELQAGQTVRAGELFCYIAERMDWIIPEIIPPEAGDQKDKGLPGDLRITTPALNLLHQLGLNVHDLPSDVLITESMVRQIAAQTSPEQPLRFEGPLDPLAMIVYGGGGHGKALIELVEAQGSYHIVGIIDDGISAGSKIMGYKVLGGNRRLNELHTLGVRLAANAVGGIGDLSVRVSVFDRLGKAGFECPVLVHPRAFVESSAQLSPGVQIFPFAYVGSQAQIGFGAIANTAAIISHDCEIADYANLSPGAILAGEVKIGQAALVGMGVTINLRVKVGAGAKIGNGATVKANVPEKGIVRAGTIWPV